MMPNDKIEACVADELANENRIFSKKIKTLIIPLHLLQVFFFCSINEFVLSNIF